MRELLVYAKQHLRRASIFGLHFFCLELASSCRQDNSKLSAVKPLHSSPIRPRQEETTQYGSFCLALSLSLSLSLPLSPSLSLSLPLSPSLSLSLPLSPSLSLSLPLSPSLSLSLPLSPSLSLSLPLSPSLSLSHDPPGHADLNSVPARRSKDRNLRISSVDMQAATSAWPRSCQHQPSRASNAPGPEQSSVHSAGRGM